MDSSLINLIVGTVTPAVVVALIIGGWLVTKSAYDRALEESAAKDAEIGRLKEALDLERQRSNDATQAGTVTNQLIGGLLKLATERREDPHAAEGHTLPAVRAPLDLTAKDVGL